MVATETKEQFIQLRAEGKSYQSIAKLLNVSKPTLIAWAKDCEYQLKNLKEIEDEALREKYRLGKEKRMQIFNDQLEAIRKELAKRDYANIQTPKLLELLERYMDKLKDEDVRLVFSEEGSALDIMKLSNSNSWVG